MADFLMLNALKKEIQSHGQKKNTVYHIQHCKINIQVYKYTAQYTVYNIQYTAHAHIMFSI